MANISIDPEQAISYGNQIVSKAGEFNKEVTNIYNIVGDLQTAWTGSAASKFTEDINKFKQDYVDFGKLINDFGSLLVAIGKDYKNMEDTLGK